jgi:hypothetical protein
VRSPIWATERAKEGRCWPKRSCCWRKFGSSLLPRRPTTMRCFDRTAGRAARATAPRGRGRIGLPLTCCSTRCRSTLARARDFAQPYALGPQAARRYRGREVAHHRNRIHDQPGLNFHRKPRDGERHAEVRVGNVETADGSFQVLGAVTRAETGIAALIKRTLETVCRTDANAEEMKTPGSRLVPYFRRRSFWSSYPRRMVINH